MNNMERKAAAVGCKPWGLRKFGRSSSGIFAVIVIALGVCAPSAWSAPLQTLKVGIPGNSVDFARWFIASDAGFFSKNGLKVIFVHLAANTLPAALVSNGIQATPLSTSIVSGSLAGFDVKLVGQLNTKLNYMILSDRSIKSVEDLKNKTIVTGPPKGGPNGLLTFILEKYGFNPKKDVKLLYVGSEAARRTLIEAHNADALIDDVAHGLELEEKFPNLYTLVPNSDMPNSFGSSAGVAAQMINNHPDQIRRMLLALAQTAVFIKANPVKVMNLLEKELKLSPSVAKRSAQVVAATVASSLVPSPEVYEGEVEIETILSGKEITSARIRAAWDTRIAAQVEKEIKSN